MSFKSENDQTHEYNIIQQYINVIYAQIFIQYIAQNIPHLDVSVKYENWRKCIPYVLFNLYDLTRYTVAIGTSVIIYTVAYTRVHGAPQYIQCIGLVWDLMQVESTNLKLTTKWSVENDRYSKLCIVADGNPHVDAI